MNPLVPIMMFVSVLLPQKGWYAPDQPINIAVKAPADVNLFLTNFSGNSVEAKESFVVAGNSKGKSARPALARIILPHPATARASAIGEALDGSSGAMDFQPCSLPIAPSTPPA